MKKIIEHLTANAPRQALSVEPYAYANEVHFSGGNKRKHTANMRRRRRKAQRMARRAAR